MNGYQHETCEGELKMDKCGSVLLVRKYDYASRALKVATISTGAFFAIDVMLLTWFITIPQLRY